MNDKTSKLRALIESRLKAHQENAFDKLYDGLTKLQQDYSRQKLFYLFAISSRWFSRETVSIPDDVLAEWQEIDCWSVLINWQSVQLARLYILLLHSERTEDTVFADDVNELFKSADVNELVLLVYALNFFPRPDIFVERAREAARSNIGTVFSAVAHNSDYAMRYFDDSGWNQLVLKAAFLAVPIWSIVGLEERNNAELVAMLKHYVWERQAASRTVPWDIWRCIAWQAKTPKDFDYLRTQFDGASVKELAAIKLALSENKNAESQALADQLVLGGSKKLLSWPAIESEP